MNYIRRHYNATAFLLTLMFCAVDGIAGDYVGQVPTTKIPTYPVKGVTIGNFGADFNGNNETPFINALTSAANANTGQKHITVVNGTYTFSSGIISALDDIAIEALNGVKFYSATSGAIGLFQFTGDRIRLQGLRVLTPTTPVNDQIVIDLSTSHHSSLIDCTIDFQHTISLGSTAAPMIGFRADTCYSLLARGLEVFPSNAVTGYFDKGCVGSRWESCSYSNRVSQSTPLIPSPPCGGWVGFFADNSQFVKLNDFSALAVGSAASDFGFGGDTSTRPKAMIWFRGVSGEDGHSVVENFETESCVCQNHILFEGVQGWSEINGARIGYGQGGQYKYGEGGIRITNNVAASRNSKSIRIRNTTIHNLGNSALASTSLFSNLRGTVMLAGARVDVTDSPSSGTANNFHLNTGSWNLTPAVGEFIKVANATAAVNNGYFKVTFADANDITVDKTLISAGALTNETSTGNDELIVGLEPFESAGVFIDNSTDVDIDGLAILDQRHPWGLVIDTTTVRGVCLDNITFHRANAGSSDYGAIAPIRLVSGTLANIGSGVDDAEGISYGIIKLKNWGATPILTSNGAWSFTTGSGFATAAPSITETNAPFMPSGLTDSTSNAYNKAGVGVATDKLSLTRRMN